MRGGSAGRPMERGRNCIERNGSERAQVASIAKEVALQPGTRGDAGGVRRAAYGAREKLRRAEWQRAGEGRERSGAESPREPGALEKVRPHESGCRRGQVVVHRQNECELRRRRLTPRNVASITKYPAAVAPISSLLPQPGHFPPAGRNLRCVSTAK